MPGRRITRTQPPGGNDRRAAERHGAGRPGHGQGNAAINTTAASRPCQSSAACRNQAPAPQYSENGILAVWMREQGAH